MLHLDVVVVYLKNVLVLCYSDFLGTSISEWISVEFSYYLTSS
jgi:N-dimethylarginine dimethylaminohydrolase